MPPWLLRGSHHGYETGTIYVRGAPGGGFLGKPGGAGVWPYVVVWVGRARGDVARRPAGKWDNCGARGMLALWGGEEAGPCSAARREVGHQTITLRLSQLFILEKINNLMQPKQQKQNSTTALSVTGLTGCPRSGSESSCHDMNDSTVCVSHIYVLLRISNLFNSGAVILLAIRAFQNRLYGLLSPRPKGRGPIEALRCYTPG